MTAERFGSFPSPCYCLGKPQRAGEELTRGQGGDTGQGPTGDSGAGQEAGHSCPCWQQPRHHTVTQGDTVTPARGGEEPAPASGNIPGQEESSGGGRGAPAAGDPAQDEALGAGAAGGAPGRMQGPGSHPKGSAVRIASATAQPRSAAAQGTMRGDGHALRGDSGGGSGGGSWGGGSGDSSGSRGGGSGASGGGSRGTRWA